MDKQELKASQTVRVEAARPVGICEWKTEGSHAGKLITDQFGNPYMGTEKPKGVLNRILCNQCRILQLKAQGIENPT